MRTENLAIVFVDIAGFTPRTSTQTRDENLRMLQRFDSVVRPLVRAYDGRVVKTIGDAYLLTFRSPTNALLCSMAVHDRIAETDRQVAEADRFSVRAAVNVGEVRIEGGDVFGEAVNIASRIEGKAGAGEIYFSESAYLSMTKSEVPSEEVGQAELKGISGMVRLYRVPRANESGYALSRRPASPAPAAGGVAPAVLPYGGHGLDRVRDLISRPGAVQAIAPVAQHAQGGVAVLMDVLRRFLLFLQEGYAWWRVEVRRNRTVQYGTIVIIAAIIILGIWFYNRKPSTPWQKFQRQLGF
jgi:class 3 adenylate cyclase